MKISVIIPCYNVEQCVDRCLESVVNQTIGLDRLEIIVVDDVSTDGTLDKLLAWEKRFPDHIMVVACEENHHAGGARNAGLAYATGEYIGFVDSDDWIEPEMYELLYEKMSMGKYDLVQCKMDMGEEIVPLPAGGRRDVEYHFTRKNGLCYGHVSDAGNCGYVNLNCLWSRLYKASMIRECAVRFPEDMEGEDMYFNGILWLYVETFAIVDVVLYHYFLRPNSLVRTRNSEHRLDGMVIMMMLMEEYQKRGAFEAHHDAIELKFLREFFQNTWHGIFVNWDYIPDLMEGMRETILTLFPNYRENPYVLYDMEHGSRYLPLLGLLEMERLRLEELEEVKAAYLEERG